MKFEFEYICIIVLISGMVGSFEVDLGVLVGINGIFLLIII